MTTGDCTVVMKMRRFTGPRHHRATMTRGGMRLSGRAAVTVCAGYMSMGTAGVAMPTCQVTVPSSHMTVAASHMAVSGSAMPVPETADVAKQGKECRRHPSTEEAGDIDKVHVSNPLPGAQKRGLGGHTVPHRGSEVKGSV